MSVIKTFILRAIVSTRDLSSRCTEFLQVISVVLVSGFLLYTLFPSAALTFALIPDRCVAWQCTCCKMFVEMVQRFSISIKCYPSAQVIAGIDDLPAHIMCSCF